jgi:hypothetical protein
VRSFRPEGIRLAFDDDVFERGHDRRRGLVIGSGELLHQRVQARRQHMSVLAPQYFAETVPDFIADRTQMYDFDLNARASSRRHVLLEAFD